MEQLNLPPFEANIKKTDGKDIILDILRRKFVALTPEEWVRQHFIHFLINCKGYPAGLLANEVSLTLNGMSRRCDSVLYDQNMRPVMIIEYKASHIKIRQNVFNQICRYNIIMQVEYLIVSNGMDHYCCHIDKKTGEYTFLEDIPSYDDLVSRL